LTQAANQKLLEEAYELFTEVQIGKKSSVLKESADVLEVVLTILKQLGYSYDDPKRAWPVT
jgi:NTP pyrophosphatase (non-canonical NTP hydrolase)